MDWIRTGRKTPCPVCQKDSWCIINQKLQLVICMRETSGRMKQFKDGSIGWLHLLNPDLHIRTPQPKPPDPPAINCTKLIADWTKATRPGAVSELSRQLQVSVYSLLALQVCWSPEHRAWAIPMKDGYDNMVGIRLRSATGDKWSVRGSHSGCFIPVGQAKPVALVVEGFSDTCAGLDIGFYTVGRPAASGGVEQLKHHFRMKGVRKAVILCDNDKPGIQGALMLSRHLGIPNCLVVTPAKDLREFVQCGGTKELLDSMIDQSIWNCVQ